MEPLEPLELTPPQRETLGKAVLDWALKYFERQAGLPVYPAIGARDLTARLSSSLPIDPQDVRNVMADFETIAANGRHNGHPRMFGYVQSSGSLFLNTADM